MTNSPPSFTSTLPHDQIVMTGSTLIYNLPPYSDPEGNIVLITYSPTILTFVSLTGNTFTFNPIENTVAGVYTITVILSDGQPLSNSYTFKLTVTNAKPPTFSVDFLTD